MYGLLSENLSGIPMTVQTRPESTKLPVKHRWFFPLSVSHPKTIYTSLFSWELQWIWEKGAGSITNTNSYKITITVFSYLVFFSSAMPFIMLYIKFTSVFCRPLLLLLLFYLLYLSFLSYTQAKTQTSWQKHYFGFTRHVAHTHSRTKLLARLRSLIFYLFIMHKFFS